MKPLHVGLLVVGAAVAGGLAVKMTEPPALPTPPAHVTLQPPPAQAASVQPAKPPAAKPPVQAAAEHLVKQISAPDAETDNSAPPPIYSEPPHISDRRSPFPAPAKKPPAAIAGLDPAPKPVPYQKPADSSPETAPPPSAGDQPPPVQQVQEPEQPRHVTLQPGTKIAVRMLETLSSDRVSAGDTFSATLAEPLIIDDLIIAEPGARVDGRVVSARRSTRMNGRSEIQLALSRISTADGQRVAISTDPWVKIGASSSMTQAEEIGGGAALGAIIGAIAGGGTGAAIGAGIGGGAGLGTAMATKAKPVSIPSETVIRFKVNSRVTITERQL